VIVVVRLSVNVDHVATLREARGGIEPDPVAAAVICELAGADGITVHLRGDRRHIKERDVRLLRSIVKTELNLEMAITEEMVNFALEVKPDQCTLVPERPGERTTEGGLDVIKNMEAVKEAVKRLREAGIRVSIFVEPDDEQIRAAKEAGADRVELNTRAYSEASNPEERERELERLNHAAHVAGELGLGVNAGHGLNVRNLGPVAELPNLLEVSIGHSIISRAVFLGLEGAVKEILEVLRRKTGQ